MCRIFAVAFKRKGCPNNLLWVKEVGYEEYDLVGITAIFRNRSLCKEGFGETGRNRA